ncbi:MAG: type II CAAX prenyl endopeptidase Rce1 family protein [Bacillota bacterium]
MFWGTALLDGQGIIDLPYPRALLMIAGTFGPSAVGLYYLIHFHRRTFLSVIEETFVFCSNNRGSTAFLTFALIPLIFAVSYLITRFFFGIDYMPQWWFTSPILLPTIYFYILLLGGPLGEEIGWRGYALPKLLTMHSPFVASLILGFVWTFWHLPNFFIPGTSQEGVNFLIFLFNIMVLSMIMTVIRLRTNRISGAFYVHANANFSIGVFYIIEQQIALLFIGIGMAISLAIILYRERHTMFRKLEDKEGLFQTFFKHKECD